MFGHTSKAVATGIPVRGFTPVTTEPRFVQGLSFVSIFTAVVTVTAPVAHTSVRKTINKVCWHTRSRNQVACSSEIY